MAGHGTRARYVAGCHCAACTEASRRYHRDHRYAAGRAEPVFRPIPLPGAWVREAACMGLETELFFATRGDNVTIARAREVCVGCVVRVQCLRYALDVQVGAGMWGGMTEKERQRMRRTGRKAS